MANTTNRTTRIKHVFGNVLKLAIPLTLRTVTLEGGIVEVTDTDYTPSSHYPVVVQFVNGPLKYELDATIRDNYIAVVEDKGTIPVGNYAIVVLCKDDNGDPRRFKQRCVLEVVDVTADAGIEVGIEFEAQEWLLDGAIFLAIKGEDGIDGVGIESITTDETSVSGEYNQVTFHLTNGSSYTLNVRNGESTEQTLPANVVVDENYVHTDNNYTDTDKQKIESVDKLFADAEYDRISRRLNFFKHGDTMHTNPLKSIDITDFVRDSRVSSFRIIDDNLTIRLNSDGNNEEFKVPISSIVNLSNYYTKAQTDAKLSQKVNLDATTGRVDASQATRVVLDYIVGIYDGEDEPSHDVNAGDVWYDNGQIHYAYNNDVIVEIISLGAPQKDIIYCNAENNKLYRWNGSEFVQVGGSGSGSGYEPPVGGIPKSDLTQSVQDTLDDVSNKVDKVAGKGLSTEDYTTAEKQKLAGLSNYDDTAIQAEVDAKYEKPNTGIPKTDLASGVQASLGKADTALQSSDLEGYATTDDVDDAVAALVSSAPQTLDTLNELAEALGDDPNFATTMATQLGNKVDKETGKSLMTDAERTKLQGIAAGAEVNVQPNWRQTNTSADDYIKNKPTIPTKVSDLTNDSGFTSNAGTITGITMNGTSKGTSGVVDLGTVITAHQDISGKANVSDVYTKTQADTLLAGKLSKSDVSVETLGDGTVDINVKDDTYTINLNHTHEGMAKLVVDTAANLPDASEMESDTIYGELDDGEIATIYLGGYPFYGGGGGASSGPVLRRPADGATIDMGQTTSGTVSKTINVKGKSLTQALTIELDGTGYSFGNTQPSGVTRDSATQLTVTAAAANTLNGVDIVVVYTGNDTDEDASGTLGITSASPDNISVEATLLANAIVYEDLRGVKLTGTQWLQTDYCPGPNTEFSLKCKFTENSNTSNSNYGYQYTYILCCPYDGNKRFSLSNSTEQSSVESLVSFFEDNTTNGSVHISKVNLVADNSILRLTKGQSNLELTFLAGGNTQAGTDTLPLKTTTMAQPLAIGYLFSRQAIYGRYDLTIYEFILSEGGIEKRHYVPKMRNGVPGLYDTKTGTFISSETNDELVAIPLT